MMDEKWSLEPGTLEDRILIDSLLAVKQARKQQERGASCPLHEGCENLIWAYADGFLEETEEDEAWEEISQCRHCLDRLATVQRSLQAAEEWLDQEATAKRYVEIQQASQQEEWTKVLALGFRLSRLLPEQQGVQLAMQDAAAAVAAVPDIILTVINGTLKIRKPLPARSTLGPAKPSQVKGETISLLKEHCRVSLESRPKSGRYDLRLSVYEPSEEEHPLTNVLVSLYDIYATAELESHFTTPEGLAIFTGVSPGNYLLLITQTDSSTTEVISVQLQ
jgi:hypothetical protein